MDLGQQLRGVDMGPGAVRYAGLAARVKRLGRVVEDAGNVPVPVRDQIADQAGSAYLPAVLDACSRTYAWSRRAVDDRVLPLFIGGDHSLSIGTIGGVTHAQRAGVVWIDAHGDVNTPDSSPSGNIHGMPLAVLLGHGLPDLVDLGRRGAKLKPEDVVLIGVRSLDSGEKAFLKELGVRVFTMREIDEKGVGTVAREALERLGHVDRLHVSLDLDSLDPREAPGVGTPVAGGLTYREAHLLMEILADTRRVGSIDVVEVNPILDVQNHTAQLAVELVASGLGKTIM
jgi:arginase